MRHIHIYSGILILWIGLLTSCEQQGTSPNNNSNEEYKEVISTIKDMPAEDVSSEEESGLMFMREEEKLARDVYIILYAKWNQKVFSNISKSEQKHTDSMEMLLNKYDLPDPVTNDEIGVFKNVDLQNLYDSLVASGDSSLVNALYVGAAIEEIDILDLRNELNNVVDSEDITLVYENLLKGSGNHLRAFVKNLNKNGITYAPHYLSEELYLEIISGQ